MEMIIPPGGLMMTSREIAGLTGKQHQHVKRDIENMLAELSEDASKFGHIYLDSMGRQQTEYLLDRELTDTLLTGYSAVLRRKVIARWRELEQSVAAPALPDFANPAAAARAWADQVETAQKALALANHATATKAEIGNRREATAMNTASQATKKVAALEIELDRSRKYSSVKRMQMLYHGQKFDWRKLKSAAQEMGAQPIEIFDANYGTVKAYHADVWLEVYALPIEVAP
jgi:phage regulator Rha-like protein